MAEISFHPTYSDNCNLLTRTKNGSQSGLQRRGCHRFGFNGKENDNEVKGTGNSVDFGARIYDSRLGRWLSVDPYGEKYPDNSKYTFALNNPIDNVDTGGEWVRDKDGNIIFTKTSTEKEFFTITDKAMTTAFSVEGFWGTILANDGTEVKVFVPTSKNVYVHQMNKNGDWELVSILNEDQTDGEKNCTSNSLVPEVPEIIISADAISETILNAEGYFQAEFKPADEGDPLLKKFSPFDFVEKGDIITYQDDEGGFLHFEIFTSTTDVDTKGGVQKGPIYAEPGQNSSFGNNTTLWLNMNLDNQMDPVVSAEGGDTETYEGINVVDNDSFTEIKSGLSPN